MLCVSYFYYILETLNQHSIPTYKTAYNYVYLIAIALILKLINQNKIFINYI